jgi:hypothetical protein
MQRFTSSTFVGAALLWQTLWVRLQLLLASEGPLFLQAPRQPSINPRETVMTEQKQHVSLPRRCSITLFHQKHTECTETRSLCYILHIGLPSLQALLISKELADQQLASERRREIIQSAVWPFQQLARMDGSRCKVFRSELCISIGQSNHSVCRLAVQNETNQRTSSAEPTISLTCSFRSIFPVFL